MRLGKVKESVLKRSVLRQLHRKSSAGSPQYGEDAGLFPIEDASAEEGNVRARRGVSPTEEARRGDSRQIAVSVNPVEGWTLAARRAVYGAVNSLAAAGVLPTGIAPVILMPEESEESELKALMREMDALCEQENLCCLAGHTAVSPFVSNLVISVTAVGVKQRNNCRAHGGNTAGDMPASDAATKKPAAAKGKPDVARMQPGMDIVVAGTVGREGAAMLAWEREGELTSRYPTFFVEEAKHLFDDGSMGRAAALAREEGVVHIHDVREGGVFAGLWELAATGRTGIRVELKQIPIRQHTIEVCEFFRLNPYMLRSGGTLLMVCENGERIVTALSGEGIPAAVVGRTTENHDKIICYDDEIRYLEPPKEDEYYRSIENGGNNA